MRKKAQGLSLNTIIIAVSVLIVLIVLILLFTGYFGKKFTPALTNCQSAGGTCELKSNGCGLDAFDDPLPRLLIASCPNEDQICCSRGLGTGTPDDDSNRQQDDKRAEQPSEVSCGREYSGNCREECLEGENSLPTPDCTQQNKKCCF